MARNEIRCSFCGKTESQVLKLLKGPNGVYICDACVELCSEIIEEELNDDEIGLDAEDINLLKPQEIKAFLDDYVIGQENAKKTLCVAVYNHYKRIRNMDKLDDVEIQKSNILLLGPTGCGKTLLAQTLAKILNVPFSIADATTLTEAGYVGEDVENILLKLIQAADYDIERAERGIIYIDEIDKITRKSENPSITRDVSGEGVQQALLKIIEGTKASVPPQGGRKHPHQEFLQINTENILFICGGAFDGIEQKIAHRMNSHVVGYSTDSRRRHINKDDFMRHVAPQDLKLFGLIPEIIGRLPIVTALDRLDRDALRRVLTEPKNAITRQYVKLFAMDGVTLEFADDALDFIVDKAIEFKLGARGLRSIVETIMIDAMFEVPSADEKTFTVTADYCRRKLDEAGFDAPAV